MIARLARRIRQKSAMYWNVLCEKVRTLDWALTFRMIIGCGGVLVAIFSIINLVSGFEPKYIFEPEPGEGAFVRRLVFWFLACLAVFHTNYAFDKELTETRVKLIDYYYLGVAVIGIIILAGRFSAERQETQRLLNGLFASQIDMAKTKADVAVLSYVFVACKANTASGSDADCHRAQQLQSLIEGANTADDIKTKISEVKNSWSTLTRFFYSKITSTSGDYLIDALEALDQYSLAKRAFEALENKTPPDRAEANPLLMLGQFVIWPFLFAFALALRITKVTIEVLGWARQKPKSSPDHTKQRNEHF